jgi:predicted aconitase
MNRLQAITALRDTCAHSAVDTAIEAISADLNRWGRAMEPEEHEHTRMILDRLLDLQANAVRSATRRGETMNIRLTELERGEAASDLEIAA